MKNFIFLIALIFTLNLFGQPYFEIINDNQMKIYLNEFGHITDSFNATYYRISFFDSVNSPLNGRIKEFYLENTILFEGYYRDGQLSDSAKYFDSNGNLKIIGQYNQGKRVGNWLTYYPNNQLKTRIKYGNDIFYIVETFNKKGKQKVTEGNGKYEGTMKFGMNKTADVTFKGTLSNGLPDGNWTIYFMYGAANEKFENGQFISGTDDLGKKYNKSVIDFYGFLPTENFNIFKAKYHLNRSDLEKNKIEIEHPTIIDKKLMDFSYFENTNIKVPSYIDNDLNYFIDTFEKEISRKINQSFYGFVEFRIDAKGNIKDKKVITSYQKIDLIIKTVLDSIGKFEPAKNSKKTFETWIYFSIFKTDNIYMPRFNFGFENMNLK